MRVRSTNVRTRTPTANGGLGLRGREPRAEAEGAAAGVALARTVDFVVAGRGREAGECAPPHPAIRAPIATPNAATRQRRDADGEDVAGSGGMALP